MAKGPTFPLDIVALIIEEVAFLGSDPRLHFDPHAFVWLAPAARTVLRSYLLVSRGWATIAKRWLRSSLSIALDSRDSMAEIAFITETASRTQLGQIKALRLYFPTTSPRGLTPLAITYIDLTVARIISALGPLRVLSLERWVPRADWLRTAAAVGNLCAMRCIEDFAIRSESDLVNVSDESRTALAMIIKNLGPQIRRIALAGNIGVDKELVSALSEAENLRSLWLSEARVVDPGDDDSPLSSWPPIYPSRLSHLDFGFYDAETADDMEDRDWESFLALCELLVRSSSTTLRSIVLDQPGTDSAEALLASLAAANTQLPTLSTLILPVESLGARCAGPAIRLSAPLLKTIGISASDTAYMLVAGRVFEGRLPSLATVINRDTAARLYNRSEWKSFKGVMAARGVECLWSR